MIISLNRITQRKKLYMEVGEFKEGIKCWIFENGLWYDSSFREKLGCIETHSLKELLTRVHPFINLERNLSSGLTTR